MEESSPNPPQPLQVTHPIIVYPRTRRRKRLHLPWPIRQLAVIAMGASVGLLSSYAIRYIGM